MITYRLRTSVHTLTSYHDLHNRNKNTMTTYRLRTSVHTLTYFHDLHNRNKSTMTTHRLSTSVHTLHVIKIYIIETNYHDNA